MNASSPTEVANFLQDNFPSLSDNDTQAAIALYTPPEQYAKHAKWFGAASGAYGESVFTCPGIAISDAFTKYNSPEQVWNYRYNVQEDDLIAQGLGVVHTEETPAVFGVDSSDGGIPTGYESYLTYNAAIVPIVMNYWISFIRSLDPNSFKSSKAPLWQPYEGTQRILFQTNHTVMESVSEAQKNRCNFWKNLAVVMEQ